MPTVEFSALLREQADLFYALVGGQPARSWRARRELAQAGISLRHIDILYPQADIFLQLSARLAAIARQQPALFSALVTAVKPEMNIRRAVTAPLTQNEPDPLAPLLQKSALRSWLKTLGAERHDRLLALSEATKVELIWWYLAWAFERPEVFAHEEQRELIAGIDALADRLNVEPAVRTAAYLQGPAQLFNSESMMIGAAVHFETCTRLDRLADLWAWSVSG